MDLILGSQKVRKSIEQGTPILQLEQGWASDLEQFRNIREKYLLYS